MDFNALLLEIVQKTPLMNFGKQKVNRKVVVNVETTGNETVSSLPWTVDQATEAIR